MFLIPFCPSGLLFLLYLYIIWGKVSFSSLNLLGLDLKISKFACIVKVTQSCPTLCDPMDCTVHGILQARILEWVAYPFSSRSSQPRNWTRVSCTASGFFTSWATRKDQEYWSSSLSPPVIFPTQELNQGLLHCRWIRSPKVKVKVIQSHLTLCNPMDPWIL